MTEQTLEEWKRPRQQTESCGCGAVLSRDFLHLAFCALCTQSARSTLVPAPTEMHTNSQAVFFRKKNFLNTFAKRPSFHSMTWCGISKSAMTDFSKQAQVYFDCGHRTRHWYTVNQIKVNFASCSWCFCLGFRPGCAPDCLMERLCCPVSTFITPTVFQAICTEPLHFSVPCQNNHAKQSVLHTWLIRFSFLKVLPFLSCKMCRLF